MAEPNETDRPLRLEETVLDEFDRTVVAGDSESATPPEQRSHALQGPHGQTHCRTSQRELLRNQFPEG